MNNKNGPRSGRGDIDGHAGHAGPRNGADRRLPFTLAAAAIALPPGAFQAGERHVLRHGTRPVLAITQGPFRPFLHPVFSPAGHVVTAERPADHPHHSGIWCAADHVALLVEGPDGIERYDYNFYVDAIFQGRAPGRILADPPTLAAQSGNTARLAQRLTWTGPAEWGAPDGRAVLAEERTTLVTVTPDATVIDITSALSPAGQRPVTLGPTRHAFFNARLADGIALTDDARPTDDRGRKGAADVAPDARWIDFSGPVGGGHAAGIAVAPHEAAGARWFVADWGVVSVGPMRDRALRLQPGETVRLGCRFVIHDGAADIARLALTPPPTRPEEAPR